MGRFKHIYRKEHLRTISYWLQRKFNVQKALVENNLTITIFDLRWGSFLWITRCHSKPVIVERRQGTVCDAGMMGLGGVSHIHMVVLTPCTTVKFVKISLERTLLITYLAPSRVTVGRASVKCNCESNFIIADAFP